MPIETRQFDPAAYLDRLEAMLAYLGRSTRGDERNRGQVNLPA